MVIEVKSLIDGKIIFEEKFLEDIPITIGRSPDCSVVIGDPCVSRRHARIMKVGEAYFVEDTQSSLGVYLDDKKLTETCDFSFDQKIRIAKYEITVRKDIDSVVAIEDDKCSLEAELQDSIIKEDVEPVKKDLNLSSNENIKLAKKEVILDVNNFLDEFKHANVLSSFHVMNLKHKIHEDILEKLNTTSDDSKLSSAEMSEKLNITLDQTLRERMHELPHEIPYEIFRQAILDELIGFGPITILLRSPRVSEIMINGPDLVFVESGGKLYDSGVRFFNGQHLISIIQRIVEPLGRHIDDASPMVDARLPDGSRVNAVIPPLALDGASVTIRKFADKKLTTDDLISFGSMTKEMAEFLKEAVRSRQNILVSGGTGSGKTTLLNVLSQFIPEGERVITIEDSAELKLSHKNLVRLEARPANIEGKGRISIRDLVVNTLRMRPDRIIVGECRGAEALDMLQAMNTGHDGSLTTAHANNPRDALTRLENMVMMAGYDLPSSAIREQIASAINLIVQQTRLPDGSRKVVKISEVTGREGNVILMQDIFTFEQQEIRNGKVAGYHTATGNIPYFIDELRKGGNLNLDMSVFVPQS